MRAGYLRALEAAASALISNPRLPDWPGLTAAVLLARASARFWHGTHDDTDTLKQALAAARAEQSPVLEVEAHAMIAYADSYWARPRHADDAALRARRILARHPGLSTPPALELAEVVRALTAADFGAADRSLPVASPPDTVATDPGLTLAGALERANVLICAGRMHEAVQSLRTAPGDPALPLLDARRVARGHQRKTA